MEGRVLARGCLSPESEFFIKHNQRKGIHYLTATVCIGTGLSCECTNQLAGQMRDQLQYLAIAFHPAPYQLSIYIRTDVASAQGNSHEYEVIREQRLRMTS
jgi:hypothetical protein